MIARDHAALSLSRRLLSVSRSSVCYTPLGERAENLALMRRIDELFLRYPFYGSRQMVRHLRREGVIVGRHRVRRLMRLMGLEAIYRAPRTSAPHPDHRVYP
jgi:putative transposase